MGLVHGYDIRNNDVEKRALLMQQVASDVAWAEDRLGHQRTVVFGDMNAHPFERPIGSVGGLHAVASRSVAKRRSRDLLRTSSRYFYNPMWNLLGDYRVDEAEEVPSGTYYYVPRQPHEFYWSMLDQVVLRPDVIGMFDHRTLAILDEIEGTSLLSNTGIPRRGLVSDHLPVIFELDLMVKASGV
jgi:hypothetical protein